MGGLRRKSRLPAFCIPPGANTSKKTAGGTGDRWPVFARRAAGRTRKLPEISGTEWDRFPANQRARRIRAESWLKQQQTVSKPASRVRFPPPLAESRFPKSTSRIRSCSLMASSSARSPCSMPSGQPVEGTGAASEAPSVLPAATDRTPGIAPPSFARPPAGGWFASRRTSVPPVRSQLEVPGGGLSLAGMWGNRIGAFPAAGATMQTPEDAEPGKAVPAGVSFMIRS